MGNGVWPPLSPYTWTDYWFDANGTQFQISLTFRYSNTAPRAVAGMDYNVDAGCPWNTLQMVKADGAILQAKIPSGSQTGTVTANQLSRVKRVTGSPGTDGLVNMDDFFLGGSITVFTS
jgi:hypothetical protein